MTISPILAASLLITASSFATAQDAPVPAPAKAPPAAQTPAAAAMEYCVFRTSKGDIVIELDRVKAPISVENFVQYVKDGFYNETVFHRVVAGFVIQGGGFDTKGVQKQTRTPIKNEWQNGLKNNRGTLSMARTPMPDSATSQFFINLKDNAALDTPRGGAAYAVFGKVISGMEVVDAIAAVPCVVKAPNPERSTPTEQILTVKAEMLTKEQAEAMAKAKAPAAPAAPAAPSAPAAPTAPKPTQS
jgi:peptidyl-prolyl cis-trans isomerase A (cyclophilin A)